MGIIDDDIAEDYRNEQRHFDSLSSPPRANDGKIARYWRGMDCPDQYTADVVYIDRKGGLSLRWC